MKLSKYIYKLACGALVLSALTSCGNDWLNVSPYDGVPSETALNNSAALESARTGMYKALKGTSDFVDYYGRNMFVYGDVRGEDVQYNASYGSGRAEFYYKMEYRTADDFGQGSAIWQSPLITIGRANRIIAAVDGGKISDASSNASVVAQYKNEARVVRALCLFDLTRVYGEPYLKDNGASLGAPIDTTVYDYNIQVGRNTVAECYTQVIKDLTEAIASGALSTSKTQGYINKWAAEALLSRVYLTKGDYKNALSVSEDVINNSPYQLWTRDQYVNAWSNTDASHTNEMLFEFVITNNSDWVDRNGYAYLTIENSNKLTDPGYGDIVITKSFSDSLLTDDKDIRNDIVAAATNDSKNVFGGRKVYLKKFPMGRYNDIPVLRLSEVYLNAAEAAFNEKDKTTAAKYLNAIIDNRTTDKSREVTASNITAQRIYMERRKELVGEGQRYFDALRRGETITRYTSSANQGWHSILNPDAQVINTWTSKKALPLIPSYEMDANSNMQQNPLY
ncbi:MAG: RagB/SusD family nutrient uptake outer membrane protein [Prevotella sp.]|jgi:tetratricopeptide (TPR) repeat protein|nr:RagB/SusD family nutrient uptake outer membrane protein [Prevotella sp.]MCH4019167.1 RagB/SusD family nutrient uptake outer membrane protein [Prevotella sp.]MCH4099248.1 RagB/SusD family nutrient uptake outer membrane protein [Prevotella sp.]MCI1323634.1 RagB/SusD family nutrient uptake outer membrane protein [Prevotella sp.]MCI1349415.1 RagB/SusD family nutrient uptake outer membrane protein [Prevotella sp.]MCI2088321.1 RagB/SusD family nutrient uptake outer membrane protein [Prevotella sp